MRSGCRRRTPQSGTKSTRPPGGGRTSKQCAGRSKRWAARLTGGPERGPLKVFTTRPDTLFGATFMVLAPEHPMVAALTAPERKAAVAAYVARAETQTEIERLSADREKTGVAIGADAINPVNGERIPIFVADYVLGGYGTGAIMAVPAHAERDYAVSGKHWLPVPPVRAAPRA